jgi:ribosomal protein L31E
VLLINLPKPFLFYHSLSSFRELVVAERTRKAKRLPHHIQAFLARSMKSPDVPVGAELAR